MAEVRRRLGDAGYRHDLVDGAVTRLLELGILDDAAFAAAWVASRDRAHPRGTRALRTELVRKGIDHETIRSVLEGREQQVVSLDPDPEISSDAGTADEAAARRLLSRNARALERVEDPRIRRQRAYTLLARHGFDPDVAGRIALETLGPD